MIKTIGLITFHGANNYGAVLQAWSLCKWLNIHGYRTEIIDYQSEEIYKHYRIFRTYRYKEKPYSFGIDLLRYNKMYKRNKHFAQFRNIYLNITKKAFYTNEDLKIIGDAYDLYICGSDQIWNPQLTVGFDPAFFLDFVKDSSKKVAFSPSIAVNDLSNIQIKEIIDYISDFHMISVRENESADMLQPFSSQKIQCINDPVFLHEASAFSELEENINIKKDFLFLYIVGSGIDYQYIIEAASRMAAIDNLKLVYLIDGSNTFVRIHGKNAFGCKPGQFLSYIKKAKYVISNSFHATAFSILYHKRFCVFLKSANGSRVSNILNQLGLESRICSDPENIYLIKEEINYDSVDNKLANIRSASENYLYQALRSDVLPSVTLSDEETIEHRTAYNKLAEQVQTEIQHYQLVRHKDTNVVRESRSGGAFTALSDFILENGGVVYGCKMDGVSRAIHARAVTKEERNAFRGSKYIQSEMGMCFQDVKQDLEDHKIVFFSGTPCQVSGLKMYLLKSKVDCSLLFTIDIICHGVPSPVVWKSYIDWVEKHYHKKVIDVDFRDKSFGWKAHFDTVIMNGKKRYSSLFRIFYYKHYILRPACYHCKFSNLNRCGDITLGDAWGIEKTRSNYNDDRGCSLVILNTEKGQYLMNQVSGTVEVETADITNFMQPNLRTPSSKPVDREHFWEEFNQHGFASAVKHYGKQSFLPEISDKITIMLNRFHRDS